MLENQTCVAPWFHMFLLFIPTWSQNRVFVTEQLVAMETPVLVQKGSLCQRKTGVLCAVGTAAGVPNVAFYSSD